MISGGRGGSIIVVGSVMADFSSPSASAYLELILFDFSIENAETTENCP